MDLESEDLEAMLIEHGELHVVLDSDREYAMHPGDTRFFHDKNWVTTEGVPEEEISYVEATFDAADVEHFWIHREI